MGNRPLAIDLFSGCGGLSLGLEAAGFDVVGAVEVDPIHALVHHFNFPYSVTVCQDISQLQSEQLLARIRAKGFQGDIDVIAGGPPCQGFSLMGKRNLKDPRNQLVFEYLRIVNEIRPKYFIFENVAGMAAGKHQAFLDQLLEQFQEIHYNITLPLQVLDSSLYGVPQKRKRLFILGSRHDVKQIAYPEATTPTDESKITVHDAIYDLGKITAYTGKDQGFSSKKLDYSHFRKSFAMRPDGLFALCHQRPLSPKIWGHLSSNHTQKSIDRFAQTPPGKTEKISRFLKLHPDGLSNTLRAGTPSVRGAHTAARPIHYQEPRCITIREAARLHTFPDWFQFHRTIWHGFREIGNAVVPLLAKKLGDEIMQKLDYSPAQLTPQTLATMVNKKDILGEEVLTYKMNNACEYWDIPREMIPTRTRELTSVNSDS